MRRSLLATLAATMIALAAPAGAGAHAQREPCPSLPGNIFEYIDIAGPWERHDMRLEVGRHGCGTFIWRMYRRCPPGRVGNCRHEGGGMLRFGGDAAFALDAPAGARTPGSIVATSDPDAFTTRAIVLALNDDGTLTAEVNDEPHVFCRPWRHDPLRCGA